MTGAAHLIVKEVHRDLKVDTSTVAGLAIRIHGPSVPNRFQRLDAVIHYIPAS